MSKVIAYKTLYFLNTVPFCVRKRTYSPIILENAKVLHGLGIEFETEEGEMVSFSDDIESDLHINKVFQAYDRVTEVGDEKQHTKFTD